MTSLTQGKTPLALSTILWRKFSAECESRLASLWYVLFAHNLSLTYRSILSYVRCCRRKIGEVSKSCSKTTHAEHEEISCEIVYTHLGPNDNTMPYKALSYT